MKHTIEPHYSSASPLHSFCSIPHGFSGHLKMNKKYFLIYVEVHSTRKNGWYSLILWVNQSHFTGINFVSFTCLFSSSFSRLLLLGCTFVGLIIHLWLHWYSAYFVSYLFNFFLTKLETCETHHWTTLLSNFSSTLFLLYITRILWAIENEQKALSYLCGSAFNTKNGWYSLILWVNQSKTIWHWDFNFDVQVSFLGQSLHIILRLGEVVPNFWFNFPFVLLTFRIKLSLLKNLSTILLYFQ